MNWPGTKRTWAATSVHPMECGQGYLVKLDETPLRTPEKNMLAVPTSELASIIAREWDDLGTEVVPASLPVTRLCNSAIDRAHDIRKEAIDRALRYGESDLLCYRSAENMDLNGRQSRVWDPVLIWAERDLAAPFVVTTGVVPVEQPVSSLESIRSLLECYDAFTLSAMQELVTLSGSVLLALAVVRSFRSPEAAWLASRVDEDWQAERWGLDPEAAEHAARARSAFIEAAGMISALEGQPRPSAPGNEGI